MPKQSKSKVQKGSLGFIYGGIIKTGYARLFCSDDIDPLETIKEFREHYGEDFSCRYIKCENPSKVLKKVLKELGEDETLFENVIQQHATNLSNLLKNVGGVKQAHRCNLKQKPTKKSTKKTTKKSKKKVESDNESEDETNNGGSDDEVSENESDNNSDSNSDNDSDNDESDNDNDSESDDEAPKKVVKKKGGKKKANKKSK
jgi:hypothetical protein